MEVPFKHNDATEIPYFFDQMSRLILLSLLVLVWLLYEGGVYFVGKPADSNND